MITSWQLTHNVVETYSKVNLTMHGYTLGNVLDVKGTVHPKKWKVWGTESVWLPTILQNTVA